MLSEITVSPAPHISKPLSTRSVMVDVVIGLAPAMIAAGYYFRLRAFVLIATCVISAVVSEWLCNVIRKKSNPLESLGDFSAVVTGIILALSVPPELPVWAAVIGSAFSIAIGKMVFGGLGANIFNPAMVGRAFLTASFGMLMTTWTVPASIDAGMPKISADNKVDARTQATPLALSKQAQKSGGGAPALNEQLKAVFTGEVGGCLGETSALWLIVGGIYLLIKRTISFHIPAAVMLSAFVFAGVAHLINSDAYASPVFHLCAGGLLIGAFFIATDPVTAPLSTKGMWIFGIGVGTITMLIRIVGEYPEGV
ncbi:MAG: RnfABCDGE type electron transport complex subunit D [Planctomycetota bacterium]|jgi:electron transport complex protein RnfD